MAVRNPRHEPVPPNEYPVPVTNTISISKRWPVPDKDHRIFDTGLGVFRFCGHCRLPKPIEIFGSDAANDADGLYEACHDCRIGRVKYNQLITIGAIPPQPSQTWNPAFPRVITLCGSTRFWREFSKVNLDLTVKGHLVFSIGAATGTDEDTFSYLSEENYESVKVFLDELHLRKIDASDGIFVINVDGYVGPSTRREVAYARYLGKTVEWLESPPEDWRSWPHLRSAPLPMRNETVVEMVDESGTRVGALYYKKEA